MKKLKKENDKSPLAYLWLFTVELNVELNPSWNSPKIHQGNTQITAEEKCSKVLTTVGYAQI